MPKILTITLNTTIDHVISVKNFSMGQVLKAKHSQFFASGKGINVARTIVSLEEKVYALGFTGDNFKKHLDIKSHLFHAEFTPIKRDTRINVTLFDAKNHSESHIRTPGPAITPLEFALFKKQLLTVLFENDIVVISGSLPENLNNESYKRLIRLCHKQKARVILDSEGPALINGIEAKPFMIKPNEEELQALYKRKITSDKDVISAAKKLAGSGIELVVVSRGNKGIIVVKRDTDETLKASLRIKNTDQIISATGSGDALVGGFALGLLRGRTLSDTIRTAMACAAANLFTLCPGQCDKATVERLKQKVRIERIG